MVFVGFGRDPAVGDRAPRASSASDVDLVSVASTPVGRTIPPGFLGVSLEYRTVSGAEQTGPRGDDRLLAQLIRNLSPAQTPVIRIGGDSTDWTWWPVPHTRRPPGVTYNLSASWVASARELAVRGSPPDPRPQPRG